MKINNNYNEKFINPLHKSVIKFVSDDCMLILNIDFVILFFIHAVYEYINAFSEYRKGVSRDKPCKDLALSPLLWSIGRPAYSKSYLMAAVGHQISFRNDIEPAHLL